ncbi:MAG: PDZ domain-containing protein [Firmicutes bacterium]|nr:PDZ domain-containing protein [Bacillota bacterium]
MPKTSGTNRSRLIKVFVILLGLFIVGLFIRTDYILVQPGAAQDLREMVTVEGADQSDQGKFYLVTVAQKQAHLWSLVYGYLHPHIEVQSLSSVIPPDLEEQEYRELLEQWMRESKNTAQVIALRRAGYDVEIISEGVAVAEFLDDSPSKGILEKGDVITAIDGHKTQLAGEVVSAVQQRRVGAPVELTVRRNSEEMYLTVITAPHTDDPKLAALGVYISTLDWEPVLPIEIKMETGEIAGPSAGLMFVLEILNQLEPGDLSGGQLIAGTGTIDVGENIGPIGGVYQKVIAAERAGAAYFFVPEENYEEARSAVQQIKLVPLKTLQEALDFLDSLAAGEESSLRLDHDRERCLLPAA